MSTGSEPRGASVAHPPHPAVVWLEVEFGSYAVDLPLWEELAARAAGPVLELGAGIGRVALHLAARGHGVTGIDRDLALVVELRRRAAERGLEVGARQSDVRALDLDQRFSLAIAPMHLVQQLDAKGRSVMLARLTTHLERSGIVSLTVVEEVPEALPGSLEALPNIREIDGWLHSSRPIQVRRRGDLFEVERSRERVSPDGRLAQWNVIERLHEIDPDELETQARAFGLAPLERRRLQNHGDADTTVLLLERR
jgi:SAM-dependent methyltransferase